MRMDLVTLIPPTVLAEIEEVIVARNFDRPPRFFTEARRKYLKGIAQG